MGGVILLFCALLCTIDGIAQTTIQSRWKGAAIEDIDAATEKKNSKGNTTGYIATEGTKFLLYNVGTGKFLTCGGSFGIQAKLLNRDFGSVLQMGYSTADTTHSDVTQKIVPNLIYTGVSGVAVGHKDDDHPYAFGVNYPGLSGDWKSKSYDYWHDASAVYGPIMNARPECDGTGSWIDGNGGWYARRFKFEKVKTNDGTNVYRIKEHIKRKYSDNGKWYRYQFYIGASEGIESTSGEEKSGLSKEDIVFTISKIDNDLYDEKTGAGSNNALQNTHYYEWQIVTVDEMNSYYDETKVKADNLGGGLLANVSSLVKDPYFMYGSDEAMTNNWKVEGTGDVSTTDSTYIWAADESNLKDNKHIWTLSSSTSEIQGHFATPETRVWNAPALRKVQWSTKTSGQYSYGLFDGVGTATMDTVIQKAGWYVVQARTLQTGKHAYLYANGKTSPFAEMSGYKKARFDDAYGVVNGNTDQGFLYFRDWDQYNSKGVNDKEGFSTIFDNTAYKKSEVRTKWQNAYASCSGLERIGNALLTNKDSLETSVLVYLNAGETLKYGVKKDDATKQAVKKYIDYRGLHGLDWAEWGEYSTKYQTFYYDADVAAFDNIQIYYLGTEQPYVFDEGNDKETEVSSKFNNTANTNKATYLKRSLKVKTWEPVVLPVNLTMAQVREYFGEEAKVAKLNGVNTLTAKTDNTITIDFKTLRMENEKGVIELANAIEAGQFYLLYATKQAHATQTITQSTDNYIIGRHNYSGALPEKTHTYTIADDDCNQLTAHGSYWAEKKVVKLGQYYFNNGDLYRSSNKDNYDIKGFRGWLSAEKIDQETGETIPAKIEFGFDADDVVTFIDGVSVKPATSVKNVYTVGGQLVRKNTTSTDGLPKGLYIVNGKKVIVK